MTVTDEQALRAAVIASPLDDTPRLVFADWLDDQPATVACECVAAKPRGIPVGTVRISLGPDSRLATCRTCAGRGWVPSGAAERAAFIRVQVELARMPSCCPICNPETGHRDGCVNGDRGGELRRRERGLFEQHARKWFPVPGSLTPVLDAELAGASARAIAAPHAVVRRGFVDEITVPTLATLFGGPCGQCGGSGDVGVEDDMPGLAEVTCPSCSGTGTAPGIAAAVFAAHPVTRVVTDREPYRADETWYWSTLEDTDPRAPDRAGIPDLVRWGVGFEHGPYPTRDAALTALSRACVNAGRKLAGLAPVAWEPVEATT